MNYHKENPCVYLYLKQAKMSCFSFSLFSSTKSENRKAEQVVPEGGGVCQWEGEMSGKGEHRAKKMCTHVCKCKNDMW
jgi:hypothetical protein